MQVLFFPGVYFESNRAATSRGGRGSMHQHQRVVAVGTDHDRMRDVRFFGGGGIPVVFPRQGNHVVLSHHGHVQGKHQGAVAYHEMFVIYDLSKLVHVGMVHFMAVIVGSHGIVGSEFRGMFPHG